MHAFTHTQSLSTQTGARVDTEKHVGVTPNTKKPNVVNSQKWTDKPRN